MITTQEVTNTEPIAKLRRDMLDAEKMATLSPGEVRFLVDAYYIMQDNRIRAEGQVRALNASNEPHEVIEWLSRQNESLEYQIKRALRAYAESHPVGKWLLSVHGIGEVISAGLLAHVDITKAPTVGHIWRFAGLDPTLKWLGREGARKLLGEVYENVIPPENIIRTIEDEEGKEADRYALSEEEIADLDAVLDGNRLELTDRQIKAVSVMTGRKFGNIIRLARDKQGRITKASTLAMLAKRPWNAGLKVLCWKAGQSFMKFAGSEKCFYGHIYRERKLYEIERNDSGGNSETAAQTLVARKYGKETVAYKAYSEGRLPDAQIDARARRFAVKLFLSHFHEKYYEHHYGRPAPLPYPIQHLGHAHKIEAQG